MNKKSEGSDLLKNVQLLTELMNIDINEDSFNNNVDLPCTEYARRIVFVAIEKAQRNSNAA